MVCFFLLTRAEGAQTQLANSTVAILGPEVITAAGSLATLAPGCPLSLAPRAMPTAVFKWDLFITSDLKALAQPETFPTGLITKVFILLWGLLGLSKSA